MSSLLRPNGRPLPVRPVDFPHWFSTRQVCAQEGSLFPGFPTWRFRVLKTALRLRPRRALSSASGQKHPCSTKSLGKKSFKFRHLSLTNHIPVHSWFKPYEFDLASPIPELTRG